MSLQMVTIFFSIKGDTFCGDHTKLRWLWNCTHDRKRYYVAQVLPLVSSEFAVGMAMRAVIFLLL